MVKAEKKIISFPSKKKMVLIAKIPKIAQTANSKFTFFLIIKYNSFKTLSKISFNWLEGM